MKRAFTLVEMLIVVALIATLMTIVLRLTSVGSDETARNRTVVRLAKLENCLSGYYAAYGSYPPVKLHNSRSIYEAANSFGVQNSKKNAITDLWSWDAKKFRQDMKSSGYSTQETERDAWNQVKAACEAQPVSLEAPDPDTDGLDDAFKSLVQTVRDNMSSGDFSAYPKQGDAGYDIWNSGFGSIYQNLGGVDNEIPWRDAQICKFGLMSFLLPRFQAMMGWRQNSNMFDGDGSCAFDQWNVNNGNVPHDPFNGDELTWKEINDKVIRANGAQGGSDDEMRKARAFLEAIPSEAATARWLPNLEKTCAADFTDLEFFGVPINATDSGGMFNVSADKNSSPPSVKVYSPEGDDSVRNLYHLSQITVRDGWGTDFFYYSAAPHQSYQIWSAGKNKRTFPPWISRQKLEDKARTCVAAWTEDDIRGMSN